jgi:7,8-dihydroneopterin aldolase/epimerase/oxygenase
MTAAPTSAHRHLGDLGHTAAASRVRRVFVRDLEIMASVGVYEVEVRYQQRVIVSVDLTVRDDYDGVSEKLSDVLDYSVIVHGVEALVQSRHFKLLETMAERIAEVCLDDARVISARISLMKPDIMAACKAVGIEIERGR